MSNELLIRHASPTLANLKTANMFNCEFKSQEELSHDLRCWNNMFSAKGLRIIPLRIRGNHCLLYLFRPEKLSKDLAKLGARRILKDRGYRSTSTNMCLAELRRRLNQQEEFPHEIGLFLGYPVEDVFGFINHKSLGCKLVGTWKVYGDIKLAQRKFAQFKKCSELYYQQYKNGTAVDKLAVRA